MASRRYVPVGVPLLDPVPIVGVINPGWHVASN
jgi:hypothetical protein